MATICCLVLNWLSGRTDMQIRLPLADRNVLREMFLNRLLGTDVHCIDMLTMDQAQLFALCDTLRNQIFRFGHS